LRIRVFVESDTPELILYYDGKEMLVNCHSNSEKSGLSFSFCGFGSGLYRFLWGVVTLERLDLLDPSALLCDYVDEFQRNQFVTRLIFLHNSLDFWII
jgi:hypothetical protein